MAFSEEEWVQFGRALILDMAQELDAVLWPELIARGSEARWHGHARVDANHMVTARKQLLDEGLIDVTRDATRGGRALVDAYHLPLSRGNATRIERTAARKRLLYARWFGWAVGDTRYPSGFVGAGGERVARASLLEARPGLYFPAEAGFGPVVGVLGTRLSGAFDSGAWMVPRPGGMAGVPLFLPIEVKNIREWIFPRSHQLYQSLAKAAVLQEANPEQRITPLLICRRKHIQTLYMGNDLGFLIVELKRQFLLPSAEYTETDVEEVRAGIGFDLVVSDAADRQVLVPVLNTTLPSRADAAALRWQSHGSRFLAKYQTLANDKLPEARRAAALDELRAGAAALPDVSGGW